VTGRRAAARSTGTPTYVRTCGVLPRSPGCGHVRIGSTIVTALAALLLAIGPTAGLARGADENALELAVKAAFLYKFQLYVTWPDRAFVSATSPFNLCIVGLHPFGPLIDRVTSGQTVGSHAVVIRRLASVAATDNCEMMYLGTSDPRFARDQLAAVSGLPVLTVTDEMEDASAKGVVNFMIIDHRVRFEIDTATASRRGLSISSKLLGVALSAKPNR
jgi:hypothetical protein